jgi:hypothetical protein
MKMNDPVERAGQKEKKKEKRKKKKSSKKVRLSRHPFIRNGTDPLAPHLADQNAWTFCFFEKKGGGGYRKLPCLEGLEPLRRRQ